MQREGRASTRRGLHGIIYHARSPWSMRRVDQGLPRGYWTWTACLVCAMARNSCSPHLSGLSPGSYIAVRSTVHASAPCRSRGGSWTNVASHSDLAVW